MFCLGFCFALVVRDGPVVGLKAVDDDIVVVVRLRPKSVSLTSARDGDVCGENVGSNECS